MFQLYIHMYLFFFQKIFSHLDCFIILNKVPCAILVIHFLVGEGAVLSLHCGPWALCCTQAFSTCAWELLSSCGVGFLLFGAQAP